MRAHQIKRVFHYTSGRLYSLRDIESVVPRLKTISSRKTEQGIFHLYREMNTHKLWMEGPFRGPETHGFLYLGVKETKSQFQKFLVEEFKLLLQDLAVQTADLLIHGTDRTIWQARDFDLDSW